MTYDIFCGICLFRERTGEQYEYHSRLILRTHIALRNEHFNSPYEMSISTAPEYQKLKALADKNEDLLRETLSDEQKELLEKLTESVTDISSISERDMFIAGFRLGMKLMIDVMKDE